MFHDLTKGQKRALREAALIAHERDGEMSREDRDVHYLEAGNPDLPIIVGGAVFRGFISLDEVGEAARELVADIAASLGAVSRNLDARQQKDDPPEKDPYDPQAVVSVHAIVEEIDALTDESTLYLNRRTGEVTVMNHEYLPDDETEEFETEDDPDGPDWLVNARAEGREMSASPDWVRLFGRFDFNDHEVMRRFARNAGPAASKDLNDALSGRGAYRRFRDVIHRRGLQEEWDSFRTDWRADQVRSRLEELGIRFRR